MKILKRILCGLIAISAIAAIALPQDANAQVVYGDYCCDAAGYHRCVLVNGPLPVGTACFCSFQGYGVVCP